MKNLATYLLCILVVFLPACALTEQQRAAGREAINGAYARGELTAAQRDDAITALEKGRVDLTPWLQLGGSIIGSILLGTPIAVGVADRRIQKKRGPTEAERKAMAARA